MLFPTTWTTRRRFFQLNFLPLPNRLSISVLRTSLLNVNFPLLGPIGFELTDTDDFRFDFGLFGGDSDGGVCCELAPGLVEFRSILHLQGDHWTRP